MLLILLDFGLRLKNKLNKEKKIKFFKTHNVYGSLNDNEFSNRSNSIGGIYIIRDPRNVITSIMNNLNYIKEDALKLLKV